MLLLRSPLEPDDMDPLSTMRAVAALLPTWPIRTEDTEHGPRLVLERPDGSGFGLHHRHGRLEIHGSWPLGHAGIYVPWRQRTHISVSISRAPATIARDIERRFLPRYLSLWANEIARKLHDDADANRAQTLARQLGALFNVEPRGADTHLYVYGRHASRFEIRSGSGTRITIDTNRADLVLRLAAVLKDAGDDDDD